MHIEGEVGYTDRRRGLGHRQKERLLKKMLKVQSEGEETEGDLYDKTGDVHDARRRYQLRQKKKFTI